MLRLLPLLLGGFVGSARAQSDHPNAPLAATVDAGIALPFTTSATVERRTAFSTSLVSPDRGLSGIESHAEVALGNRVAIRAGAAWGEPGRPERASVGARVQLLAQKLQGVDAAVGVFYVPFGYEGQAELQTLVTISRRQGRVSCLVNFVYGQELATAQRHGEVRLAALYHLSARASAGADARAAFDLDDGRDDDVPDRRYDVTAGPVLSYALGGVSLMAQTGVNALALRATTRTGAVAIGGINGFF